MKKNRNKMKMIKVGILGIVFLFMASLASAALVHLDPLGQTVHPGDDILITVKGSGFGVVGDPALGVTGGSISLTWDPNVMSLNGPADAPPGTTDVAPFQAFFVDQAAGLLNYTATTGIFASAGHEGVEFDFLNLAFTAIAPPSTVLSIGMGPLGDWQYSDFTSEPNVNYQGADITVVNPIPIPGALWLFGSGLLGLVGIVRRRPAK